MKSSFKSAGIGFLFAGVALSCGATTLLNFDDLSPGPAGSYAVIKNGYSGLQWSGFGVLDATLLTVPDGYQAGMISTRNVAFNYDQFDRTAVISSGSAFNLDSAYLTAQVVEGMQVEVQGFVGAQLTYDNTYTLSASSSTLVHFNYSGIDQVKFIPVNPITIFVMDNLTVTLVPEPDPSAFLLVGMALSALAMMKKAVKRPESA